MSNTVSVCLRSFSGSQTFSFCRSPESFVAVFPPTVQQMGRWLKPPIFFTFLITCNYRRDGVVVRASASQSVDLAFNPLVESYQKTLNNGIHSFPAWRSAFGTDCGEQAGKFACCVLEQRHLMGRPPSLRGRQVAQFSL